MRKKILICLAFFLVAILSPPVYATVSLFDWAFYVDGIIYEDSMPTEGSLDSEGLGILSWSTEEIGSHNFISFFDYEIDESINTFFNEYGSTSGAPDDGQSWEIDEPGKVYGDIYSNLLSGSLDNTNGVPERDEDDVSMAIGWEFSLDPGEMATIIMAMTKTAPSSGFYLSQIDPDSDETIYFSSTLSINAAPVPEPSTIVLMGLGLVGLAGYGRKRMKQ